MNTKDIGFKLKKELGLNYYPIGILFSDTVPENAKKFAKKGNGCIVPLIFSSAKGQVVAIDKDSTGWACSAFYLGYQDWIFEGIECFLSDGMVFGRNGERFIKTKKQSKEFVSSFIPEKINQKATIFKPLEEFTDSEHPEIVVFFATPDELSGLIYLLHFNAPCSDELVITGFNSGCGSILAKPMKLIREGKKKAVWGMHDISARLRLPKDVMTLAMPYSMVTEMVTEIDASFVITDNWRKIKERNLNPHEISNLKNVKLSIAELNDLNEILELQKEAYIQEAEIYNNFEIQPLTQKLDSLTAEWQNGIVIKAETNGQIVGSVRAQVIDNVCQIGKLIVKPDFQNQGIGKKLMTEIEKTFDNCPAYELFTGNMSKKNLAFYRKLGYKDCREEQFSNNLKLIYLQKQNEKEN